MNGNRQWDGEPADKIAYFGMGLTDAFPVAADWNNDGATEIGVYKDGTWYMDKSRNWQWEGEFTDSSCVFGAGLAGEVPVAGRWWAGRN